MAAVHQRQRVLRQLKEIPASLRANGSKRCPRSVRSVKKTEPIFPESKLGAAKQRPKVTDETFLVETEAGKFSLQPDSVVMEKPFPANPKALTTPTAADDSPQYYRVMFDYEPEHEDELRLKKGDLVLLLNKDILDQGWWEGQVHGKRGLFPDNIVMPLTQGPPGIKSQVPAKSKDSATKSAKKFFHGSKVDLRHLGDHKEAHSLDALLVPSAKLSQPTADRPKMLGKRPPSHPTAGSGAKEPSLPVTATASETPPREEHLASREDLSSLKTHVELLCAQHRRDMEELRATLEAEVEQLKHALAHVCKTVTFADGTPSLNTASSVQNSCLSAVSTKDC